MMLVYFVKKRFNSNCSTHLLKNFIPVKICSDDTYAMIDTVSDICVTSTNIFNKQASIRKTCKIQTSDNLHIVTASNEKVVIEGMVYIDVQIGQTVVTVNFYLIDKMLTEFILGLDILKQHDVSVEFATKTLSIDTRYTFHVRMYSYSTMSEVVIIALIRVKSLPEGVVATTWEEIIHSEGCIVCDYMCNVLYGKIFVRCANVADKPVEIPKGKA